MAITLACPRCTHKQTFDDDQVGQKAHCKICHHEFTVQVRRRSGGTADQIQAKTSPRPPEPGSRRSRADEDEERPRKSRRQASDDDEDVEPRRARREDEGSTVLVWVLVVIAGFLLLGGGVLVAGLVFVFTRAPAADEVPGVLVINDPPPAPVPAWPMPQPPAMPIVPPPQVRIPPPAPQFDPQNPAELDRVLASLRDPQTRAAALNWLGAADPKHPRRDNVARALEGMLAEQLQPTFPNDAYFRAYFRWATRANVPGLIGMVENTQFTVWHNQRRQTAMKTLGELKETSAAPAIARRLADHFDRGAASAALKELGPAAENAVVPLLNSLDRTTRLEACRLLAVIGTRQQSGQALATALQAAGRDPQFRTAAQQSLDAINARP